jgi:O-acetyl-ADP-ribose deacetylase
MITRPLPRLARPYDTEMPRIELIEGDITTQEVDAIVNAANRSLMGGGGVDGAIHRRGGPAILEACREIRRTLHPDGLPTGEAVATTAGELAARWVIHTVGPVYGNVSDPADLLARCHLSSLRIADELGAGSIAFPAISTGVYGYPLEEAATVAIRTVRDASTHVERVRFVLFGADALATFEDALTNG